MIFVVIGVIKPLLQGYLQGTLDHFPLKTMYKFLCYRTVYKHHNTHLRSDTQHTCIFYVPLRKIYSQHFAVEILALTKALKRQKWTRQHLNIWTKSDFLKSPKWKWLWDIFAKIFGYKAKIQQFENIKNAATDLKKVFSIKNQVFDCLIAQCWKLTI